jgi:peptidoglycan hydrolase CwlO-like protein
MELILLVLILSVVFGRVLRWVKTDELTRRQDHAEQQVRELQASLTKIQGTVARLDAAPGKIVAQAPAAAPPKAAQVAAAAVSAPPAAVSARPAAAAPVQKAPPPRPRPAREARRGWVAPGGGPRAPRLRAGHLGRPDSRPSCRARDRGAHAPRARPHAAHGR